MSGRMVELGYATAWRLVRALPAPMARMVGKSAADLLYRRRGPAVRRLAENLRRVVGPDLPDAEFEQLLRRGMRSYARYWLEVFRLPSLGLPRIRRGFRLINMERLAQAVEAGSGAVVALPHGGNWDAAGAWVVANGWPLTTVAERLRPEGLYERFVAFREGLGMRVIPQHGGQRPPMTELTEALHAGHVVALLADRGLSRRGIEVDFFGARAQLPAGPAILALRTNAPLFVVEMWYEPDIACGRLHGPLPLPEDGPMDVRVQVLTQRIADTLAAGIAAHPEDWHMLQRVWRGPASDGRRPAGESAAGESAVPRS